MTGGDGPYLGVDVGTSAPRVSLVCPGRRDAVIVSAVIVSAVIVSAGYRAVRGGDERVEQDPAARSRALALLLRRSSSWAVTPLIAGVLVHNDLGPLSVSWHGC
jgi:hypothetical protein